MHTPYIKQYTQRSVNTILTQTVLMAAGCSATSPDP